jgi:hypothetical protein
LELEDIPISSARSIAAGRSGAATIARSLSALPYGGYFKLW